MQIVTIAVVLGGVAIALRFPAAAEIESRIELHERLLAACGVSLPFVATSLSNLSAWDLLKPSKQVR
ncbi:MAG: hypothetical protein K2X38_10275 [Gemmataceae bacterium]|nr:hypothetical protein [Gemmataceae bacterium]